jgi:CDP-glycerol glycerophosphotransferase (TagB/SpsB family)
MKILADLRYENASLVADLWKRGHYVYCERDMAMYFRELLNVPVQPFDYNDNAADLPEPFKYGNQIPSVIDTVLDMKDIDAVMVWTDAPAKQRSMVLAARHLGIPSFEITHGAANTYRQGHFECKSYVDWVLAPGQHERDFRTFYGGDNNVEVIGKPSLDWTNNVPWRLFGEDARVRFKVPKRRPVILYAMTWRHNFSTWERDKDVGDVEVVQAHMNLQPVCKPFLIIKPHYVKGSKDTCDQIRKWGDDNGLENFSVMSGDPMIALSMCDLIVTHKSSIAVEAMLLDKPCVMFDFRARNDFPWFQGYGIECVSKRDEMYPAIARCLLDKPTRRRLAHERPRGREYFNGACDGKAGERAVAFIEKVVGENTDAGAATAAVV